MNEIILFVFGTIATIAAVGPLMLALVLDARSDDDEK